MVRQYTSFINLMDNWDTFEENLATATGSTGELDKQAEIYAESWEASKKRVLAAAQGVYDSLLNPEVFITVTDGLSNTLEFIEQVIDGMGGLSGVIINFGALFSNIFLKKIALGYSAMYLQLLNVTGVLDLLNLKTLREVSNLTKSFVGLSFDNAAELQAFDFNSKMLDINTLLYKNAKNLTEEEYNLILAKKENFRIVNELLMLSLRKTLAAEDETLTYINNMSEIKTNDKGKRARVNSNWNVNQRKDATLNATSDNSLYNSYMVSVIDVDAKKHSLESLNNSILAAAKNAGSLNIVDKELREILQEGQKSGLSIELLGQKLKNITSIADIDLDLELFDLTTEEGLSAAIEQALKLVDAAKNAALAVLKELKEYTVKSYRNNRKLDEAKQDVDGIIERGIALGEKEGSDNYQKETLMGNMDNVSEELDEAGQKALDFSDKMSIATSTLFNLGSVITSVTSLMNIFKDESLSGWERTVAIFSSVSMIGMNLIPIMTNLSKLITKDSQNKLANYLVTKIYKNVTLESATANLLLAASFGTIAIYLVAIVTVIALVVHVIKQLSDAWNADAIAMQKAEENVLELTNSYNEAKESAEALKTSISNWESAIDSLDGLVKGTQEYKDKLKEANELAKELIETYHLWDLGKDWYYDVDGAIKFYDGALEEVQDLADLRVTAAEATLLLGKIDLAEKNIAYLSTKAAREIVSESASVHQIVEYQNVNNGKTYEKEQWVDLRQDKDALEIMALRFLEIRDLPLDQDAQIAALQDALGEGYVLRVLEDEKIDFLNSIANLAGAIKSNTDAINTQTKNLAKNIVGEAYSDEIKEGSEKTGISENLLEDIYGKIYLDEVADSLKEDKYQPNEADFESSSKLLKYIDSLDYDYNVKEGGEDLLRVYAQEVAGFDAAEVLQSTYTFSGDKRNLSLGGKKLFDEDLTDEQMRRELAYSLAAKAAREAVLEGITEEEKEATSQELDNYLLKAKEAGNSFGVDGTDFANAVANAVASGGPINMSTLLTSMSPEQVAQMLGWSEDDWKKYLDIEEGTFLGEQFGELFNGGLEELLKQYDPAAHYETQFQQAKETAANVGGILSTLSSGEALSDELKNLLEELKTKYTELYALLEQGGHAYLLRLREILELEEKNALLNLWNEQNAIGEKFDAYDKELKKLEALNNLKEAFKNEGLDTSSVEQEIKLKEESLNQMGELLDERMAEFVENEREIKLLLDVDFLSDIDLSFGIASELEKISEYAKKDLIFTIEDIEQAIADGYEGMLDNAQKYADGSILIDENTKNSFIAARQAEYEAEVLKQVTILKAKRGIYELEITDLQQQLDVLLSATGEEASAEAKLKAAANALAQKLAIETQATTNEMNLELDQETLSELAKLAADFVNDLSGILKTSTENYQNNVIAETKTTEDGLKKLIEYYNRAQEAIVKRNLALEEEWTETQLVASTVDLPNPTSGTTNTIAASTREFKDYLEIYTALTGELWDKFGFTGNLNNKLSTEAEEWVQGVVDATIVLYQTSIAALQSKSDKIDGTIAMLMGLENISGGDTGSGNDKDGEKLPNKKELEDVLERYREINREIERQEALLEDIDNQLDRTYGLGRLSAYDKKLKELTNQLEKYNTKMKEAEYWQERDRAALEVTFREYEGLTFDANGEIENYENLIKYTVDEYNAFIDEYKVFLDEWNALSEAEQEARLEELDDWKLREEAADLLVEKRKEAIDLYEETLDVIQEINDAAEELARNIEDAKLDKIEHRLEIVIDSKEMRDELREFKREFEESIGDTITHGLTVAALDKESVAEAIKLTSEWRTTAAEYEKALDEATDATDINRILENLEELHGLVLDNAGVMLEWLNGLETMLSDTLTAASERFEIFTGQLEHNTTVLETIKELYALLGVTYKTAEGYAKLLKVNSETLEALLATASLLRQWFENARSNLLEAEAKLATVQEEDAAYDYLKVNRDALLTEYNEAQQAMLSSAQTAMQTALTIYTEALERTIYDFGLIVSNGVGLEDLRKDYDRYIETEERYLDKVNEAYEVASWYNKLLQDIDETTSAARREELRLLQEEIDNRRENNTLSQYDLDILEAKYNLLQAQMALEDAQNAKTELRLMRDSQGNWNYQYTANSDDINSAQQDLLDAENEYYNIAKDLTKEVTDMIISTWEECSNEINEVYSDMNMSDEERTAKAQEIYAYYVEKIKLLENERTIAINDATAAGKLSIDDFNFTYGKDLEDMTLNTKSFEDALSDALKNAEDNFKDYLSTVSEVAKESGTDLEHLADMTDRVSEATDDAREEGLKLIGVVWDEITAVRKLTESWADYADAVRDTLKAEIDYADYIYNLRESNVNKEPVEVEEDNLEFDPDADYSMLMYQSKNDEAKYNEYMKLRDMKIAAGYGDENTIPTEWVDMFIRLGRRIEDYGNNFNNVPEEEWEKIFRRFGYVALFDTGGYTGNFTDGKLAFLHEKELILNLKDTENILAAVSAVRQIGPDVFYAIEKALDNSAFTALTMMSSRLNGANTVDSPNGVVELHVVIEHVEFPNVTSSDEIQDAFASIVNDAFLWSRRSKD